MYLYSIYPKHDAPQGKQNNTTTKEIVVLLT